MFLSILFHKKSLVRINVVYIFASFLLMGAGSYAKYSTLVDSLPIVGGIVACGIFLIFVAIFGIAAVLKNSQSWMFYYMIFLGIILLFQLPISIAGLGMSEKQEIRLIQRAWKSLDDSNGSDEIHSAEKTFGCCGFDGNDPRRNGDDFKNKNSTWYDEIQWCVKHVPRCKNTKPNSLGSECATCKKALTGKIDSVFNKAGGLGLFLASIEVVTLVITYIYRERCANVSMS